MSRFPRQGRAPQSAPESQPSSIADDMEIEGPSGPVGPSCDAGQVDEQPPREPTKFRVGKDTRISWHGQMTFLRGGAVLDSSGYGGPPGVKRLRDQGVELIPLE
jgi:hypothetical protein